MFYMLYFHFFSMYVNNNKFVIAIMIVSGGSRGSSIDIYIITEKCVLLSSPLPYKIQFQNIRYKHL